MSSEVQSQYGFFLESEEEIFSEIRSYLHRKSLLEKDEIPLTFSSDGN